MTMWFKRFASPALLVMTVLYVLSPIDLINDRVPFLGRLDDLLVVVAAVSVWLVRKALRRPELYRHLGSRSVETESLDFVPALVCPGCGTAISPDSNFCINCGVAVSNIAGPEVPPPESS